MDYWLLSWTGTQLNKYFWRFFYICSFPWDFEFIVDKQMLRMKKLYFMWSTILRSLQQLIKKNIFLKPKLNFLNWNLLNWNHLRTFRNSQCHLLKFKVLESLLNNVVPPTQIYSLTKCWFKIIFLLLLKLISRNFMFKNILGEL